MTSLSKEINFRSIDFINKLRSRDPEAITELVRNYTGQLLRASLGLGFDSNTSKELVQTVWATFFDVVPAFKGKSHIRTFVFGILYNKASEFRRAQQRYDLIDKLEDSVDDRFDSNGYWVKLPVNPETSLLGMEALDEIQKCMDSLPLNQRMAFVMKEVEERENLEVSKILDITITHLGVLIHRARKHLRDCIGSKLSNRKTGRQSC